MKKISIFLFAFLTISTLCLAATKETLWYPDTCNGCAVVYEWDDSVPESERIHTFKRIEKPDQAHSLETESKQFENILEENKRKNIAIEEIKDSFPELLDEKGHLKEGVEVKHSYDSQRKLQIEIIGVDVLKKNDIKTALKNKLGSEKVDVQ